ncbi:MAG: bifunctional nitrate reductase/sulfite reductase flavoprotein subunit alpha [Corticimicrobacter sp.]|uniref:bifunctional nitrate reductase/sulfite reductase flavoprotein subunit alpha n=1 Tax=Corticimicrobacter sp. TaxID=2678536 RepID=UPI0032DA6319
MAETVKSVCPYCGVGCGIVLHVEGQRVIKVSGDRNHPSNAGRLCTKGQSCHLPLDTPGRLADAWVRTQRRQEPMRMDIDAALRDTARRLRHILDTHGPDAISLYVSGQMSLEAQYLANKLAKGYIRTRHIESNSRLCMASAGSGYKQSLGADAPPGSYQDFDHADLFFVIGANMADCHPILYLRMMDRIKAGARLIVVDPRRTATADKAHLYLPIRPGSDLALLNGLLYLLVAEGHIDPAFIAQHTDGWDTMPAFLADYAPAQAAAMTGLPEADIRTAARWIAKAGEWMSCWTMGLNQSTHGTWHTNALCNLHLATGKICRPGSGPFSLTGQPNAMGGREMGYMGPGLPGQRSALQADDRTFIENLWQLAPGTLRSDPGDGTVAMFEQMRDGQIKACWIICTNPVASAPNRQTVIDGLGAAELVIAQDAFLDTETNAYADVLLPGALWAESDGVMINSERNLTLARQAVPPPGQAMADWRIIARIACEMGYADAFDYACASDVFDEIRQTWNPATGYDLRGASHARLRDTPLQWPCPPDDPQDRHPIRYLHPEPAQGPRLKFATANGRAVFFARPCLPAAELPDTEFPLILNTGRLQHQWHTMTKTGKVPALNRLNPAPFIEIHPEDAAALGLTDQMQVEIRSRRGKARLPASISDRVQPGSCFAPFHWSDVFGENMAINALTSDAVDPISLQPELKYCAISLTPIASETAQAPECITDTSDTATRPAAPLQNMCTNIHPALDIVASLLGLDNPPTITLEPDEQHYVQGYLTALGTQSLSTAGVAPVLPLSAPLKPAHRLFLDGLLAGLLNHSVAPAGQAVIASPSAPAHTAQAITLLWASQTGNAETLARQCAQHLRECGLDVTLSSMDAIQATDLARAPHILACVSTFGDGEPPDHAAAFWQALCANDMHRLGQSTYAVLALGDSSYDQFCGFGRQLDQRLAALGARQLTPCLPCEPDTHDQATAWCQHIAQALTAETLQAPEPTTTTAISTVAANSAPTDAGNATRAADDGASTSVSTAAFSRKKPLLAHLVLNQRLNLPGSAKDTRQFGFDLADSGLRYEAGDALGVWPHNDPAQVSSLLSTLALAPDTPVELNDITMPLGDALLHHLDITRITTDLLHAIHERSQSELLTGLLQPAHKTQLQAWLWGRQLTDLLAACPIRLSAPELLSLLKRLQPRLYSISSSQKVIPQSVHLTVGTIRYLLDGQPRGGVCSTFLAERAESGTVPIFVQKSPLFKPPADPDAPMIMIGPGTGIAPFRAFLQDREADGAHGPNWLFFGEQHQATDFYYRQELDAWLASGHLNRLDTAFSRDQDTQIYVQHRMLEQGALLWRRLQENGHLYICGDAARMARDVDATLRQIARTHGGLTPEAADLYIDSLAQQRRYLKDVY